jgi:hypothetical protein
MKAHYPNWSIGKPLETIFGEIAGSWTERLAQQVAP